MLDEYGVYKPFEIEDWSIEEIQKFQLEQIKKQISHAYNNCKFYRNKFENSKVNVKDIHTFDDLEHIPFTTKDEIRGDPWILLSVPRKKISQIHTSTGTTGGKPVYSIYTWDDLYINDMMPKYKRLVWVEEDDIVINALPYEMSSAGLSFHRVFQFGPKAIVVPVGKGGYYSTPEKTINIMNDTQATVMITTPSYAVYLSEVAETMGIKLGEDIKLKKMWITGEGCSPAFRNRVENIWGCPAYIYYGSLEGGPMGIECKEKNGLHIAMGHVYVEIVDEETGKVLDPGEVGEITITTLLKEAAPLIRYRTGDIGYVDDVPCPCGIPMSKIHLRGRKEDILKIDSSEYSPYFIEQFLMSIPEVGNWYQFIITDKGLLINVEISKQHENENFDEIEKIVNSRIEYGIGIPVQTHILPVGTLPRPRGKIERVKYQKKKIDIE